MRNWTIKEAVEVINANQDQEAIKEIAKHFPQFFMAVCKNDLVALTSAMGEKFTLRRLQFNATAAEMMDDEENTDSKATEDTDAGEEDLSAMSTKELMKLCDKRGIKVPHYGKNKQFYLDALQGGVGEEEEEEKAEDAGEETDEYEGKSAMELYKLCKKRGISVEPKKSAKTYIAALKKADEAGAEDEAEDEGWDEAEEEEEKPTSKPANKKSSSTKAKGKGKKDEEPTEDDGDDWDI